MKRIDSFLEKHFKNSNSKTILKERVIEIINKISKSKIEKKDLEIKRNIIYLKINPIEKHNIFISKQKILEEIKSKKIEIRDVK